MSKTLNGSDQRNSPDLSGLPEPAAPKKTAMRSVTPLSSFKDSWVTFQLSDGPPQRGTLTHFSRHAAFFELYNPPVLPRLSQTLPNFGIILQEQKIYYGHATVTNVFDAGTRIICETGLQEPGWAGPTLDSAAKVEDNFASDFKLFLNEWQKLYQVSAEFKVVIADLQTFLQDLRLWSETIELSLRNLTLKERAKCEQKIAALCQPTVVPAIRNFFDRFEAVSSGIPADLRSAHYSFGKRAILPLLMDSPFVHRTYSKPLGYAGDYEMVNMMFRNAFEGGSLHAKMINLYALQLPPIVAHRNRIQYLRAKLSQEALRMQTQRRKLRVFNLGCGPAHEIQRFVAEDILADNVHFTLADFNDETLGHTNKVLADLILRHRRKTIVNTVKRPVQQVLKDHQRSMRSKRSEAYEMIYCAGLFDYLTDQVCRQLMEAFYELLAPGGLLIATNVDHHPAQYQMECFLEWCLVHRDKEKMHSLVPAKADPQELSIKSDSTGVNMFIEIRKPGREE